MHPSARGSTYASGDDRQALDAAGMLASKSRRGGCWDNAVAESRCASLKGESIEQERPATTTEAIGSIAESVDRFLEPGVKALQHWVCQRHRIRLELAVWPNGCVVRMSTKAGEDHPRVCARTSDASSVCSIRDSQAPAETREVVAAAVIQRERVQQVVCRQDA